MGVFPEPARCADDVSRLVPGASARAAQYGDETAAWPPRAGRGTGRRSPRCADARSRLAATLLAGLIAGASLPGTAFAPPAQAHGRIDTSPRAAWTLAAEPPSGNPATWGGLPVADQEPPTTTLIAGDLAGLPRITRQAGADDAVRFGTRSVARRVIDTIVRASEEVGVDPVYMMALADTESGFDTDARAATSSALGLFQFVTGTWLEMIRDHGTRYGLGAEAASVTGRSGAITVAGAMRERVLALRRDPRVAALMAAELVKRDRGRIEAKVGRALSAAELYLAHVLGGASAGRFLSLSSEKPEAVAERAFRGAARANRSLFTQKAGSARRSLTVAELQGRIEGMIDRRLNRYQGVSALAGVPESAPLPADAPAESRRVEVTQALPPDGM